MDNTTDDSTTTESDSDSDSCDMGPWESLPIDSMMLALNIQKAEGQARHIHYHEKLEKLKERQEALLQRKLARLKKEGINIDAEALKRRSRPRPKKSAWAGDDDDDHKRRGKHTDYADEDSDDMYSDSEDGSEEESQEPRDYAEWYAKQYGCETETLHQKSAGQKSKNKKKKNATVKTVNEPAKETLKINAFRTLRNVVSATNFMGRKVFAKTQIKDTVDILKKLSNNEQEQLNKPDIKIEPEDKRQPDVEKEEPAPAEIPATKSKPSFRDVKHKLKRANVKANATAAFYKESPRTKSKKSLISKKTPR